MRKILLYLICLTFSFACNEIEFDCFQSTGPIESYELDFTQIDSLIVHDNIAVSISSAPHQRVVTETGKNLFSDLQFIQNGKTLTVYNNNYCNWVREKHSPILHLSTSSLKYLSPSGSGDITSANLLTIDTLTIFTQRSSSSLHLKINSQLIRIISNSISPVTLEGDSEVLSLGMYYNIGNLECSKLKANTVTVNHRGLGRITVNPIKMLSVNLYSEGDVEYVHQPDSISVQHTGGGELIGP
ncbi:DUF2807 domain-containing protein [Limibacter armeniacum]|uniref:GIN domain-containing protein n=1 Tax=Limibacter armeniacum TaxID=466084 RepID=UPI002FE63F4A